MSLSLLFLGPFQVTLDGAPVTAFATDLTRALLAYLAVEADRPHRREALAGMLWPDRPETAALTNLRQSLARLRRAIGDHEASPPYLIITPKTIQFNADAATLDVVLFQNLIATCEAHVHDSIISCPFCIQRLRQAADLYQGPFLQGFFLAESQLFEEWALFKQEQLHRQALEVLQLLTAYHAAHADYDQGRLYAERQLALEPWREEAHRYLMWMLAASGQRSTALAQYETCRKVLADELAVEPDAETTALYEQIKSGALEPVSEGVGGIAGGPPSLAVASARRQDWGDAPQLPEVFHGRRAELTQLHEWLVRERCHLVVILGMGGMGKTALAARAVRRVVEQFDHIIWRSLLNSPPLSDIVRTWLQFLSDHQLTHLPDELDELLSLLFDYLRQRRCLLVLDNAESILQGEGQAGRYRRGHEGYGQLFRRMGETDHQSCLLITSREGPQELWRLERDTPLVRSLQLAGIEEDAGQELLKEQGLTAATEDGRSLVACYSGNPLALKLVADTIHDLFEGDITLFLRHETPIFDDIRGVLDQQFARLSALEQEILIWLAIEREPVSLTTLYDDLLVTPPQSRLLEAIHSLQRRSLLERVPTAASPGGGRSRGFALQNVVTEYITDRLIGQVYQEIVADKLNWLNRHALLKAQAKEYVRVSQTRLLLHPIGEQLLATFGRLGLESKLKQLLANLRAEAPLAPGYAAGNILNLLLYLGIDVRGYDFSRLAVWQAYLRGATLHNVAFTEADLTNTAFTDAFGFVLSVSFSPDGQLLAAATGDGQIRLWRTADVQPAMTLRAPVNFINCIAFSPDGQMLAAASGDHLIRLWDVGTRQVRQTLVGHTLSVLVVAFSPDGRLLASRGEDETVRLWDAQSGQVLHVLQGHTGAVGVLAFSPVDDMLATGGNKTVRLWDARQGTLVQTLEGHSRTIRGLAFSPTGRILVSASEDGTARLWDTRTGAPLRVLPGDRYGVWCVAFSPDGEILATGEGDWTLRMWNIQTGQILHILQGHRQIPRAIAFSPDGQILASGSEDRTVRLWDPHTGQALHTLQGYSGWVRSVAWGGNSQDIQDTILASGGEDQVVHIWDLRTGQMRHALHGHIRRIWCVAVSPDRRTVASAGEDYTIRLWDAHTRQALQTLEGDIRRIWFITFSPDGETLASASDDHAVHLWDVRSGQLKQKLYGHTNWIFSVAFSPDGKWLASGGADETVRIWNIYDGECLHALRGHNERVWSVAFSHDGKLLASGSEKELAVRLWDPFSGELVGMLTGHTKDVRSVAFSPIARILASSAEDGTARLWDVDRLQTLHLLHGHSQGVRSVAFSSNGRLLATGSYDETVRLWDVQTGACVETLRVGGPYARMNITGATGLSKAQKSALQALGAIVA